MERLTNYIDQLPAFKMPESHFRIGTKLHISDFFYAKRFFQNSFFATRIAFQITSYILDHHIFALSDKEKAAVKKEGLTLVGYGLYAELLLSLIEQFLKKSSPYKKINHNVVNDLDESNFVKHYQETYRNVIMIVPIASTFSTSFKMDEIVYKVNPDAVIMEPHINVIVIVNELLLQNGITDIEKQFGWQAFDAENRTISVGAITPKEKEPDTETAGPPRSTRQHYFLRLESNWQDVDSCKICFHTPLLDELPLIVTDKSSLTPALIFDRPQGRNIAEHNRRTFTLDSDELSYAHFKRAHNHYLFYIRIERFFEVNKTPIAAWLKKIRTGKIFKRLFRETDQVVIVAPGHYSNAGFVNMVNELLFSNAANILHYDPSHDHIQNFQLFFKNEIGGPDRKIFFVDDTITTGTTFLKTNYYLKHTRTEFHAFDGCIILLDRSAHMVYNNVINKLPQKKDSYFAYANLQLPSLNDVDQECPLCREKERYEKLADSSLLDKLKTHFLRQSMKLQVKTEEVDLLAPQNQVNQLKYLRKIEGIHRIFEWFSQDHLAKDFSWLSFEEWLNSLITQTKSPFDRILLTDPKPEKDRLSVESSTVLKLLTQSPFTYYRPLKGTIFKWVLVLLDKQCKKIRLELSARPDVKPAFPYHSFRDFKFLVRRAGLLNANFLISKDFFDYIRLIFSDHALQLLREDCTRNDSSLLAMNADESTEHKLRNFTDFNVFFVAQIKELLFLNEAKSIRLEEVLYKYETDDAGGIRTFNGQFRQLLRLLNEENGLLIDKFWEMVSVEHYWEDTHAPSSLQIDAVRRMLESPAIKQHYRFKSLEKFLNIRNKESLSENHEFLNYLCLMNFLSTEKSDKGWKLYEKTGFVIERLRAIMADAGGNPKIFMVIKYPTSDKNPYFFAHNESEAGKLNEQDWIDPNFDYLVKFLEGVKDKTQRSSKTVVEFHLQNEYWMDQYAVDGEGYEPTLDPRLFAEGYDRLLLLRINKRKLAARGTSGLTNEETPQAVIGFFSKTPAGRATALTPISKLRFLLLLRGALSNFIVDHHENNEFRDWIEANNKQRTALLTGHGREMLIDLARKDGGAAYKSIVNTILLVQRFIIDLDDAKKAGVAPGAIIEVFRQIFGQTAEEITNVYQGVLQERCTDIFKLPEIENAETVLAKVNPAATITGSKPFSFPKDILDMICFELFLNAKKNRWLFTPGETVVDSAGNPHAVNQVTIAITRDESGPQDKAVISITNTGPSIGNAIDSLQNNRYHNVKGNNSIAGLALISQLLEEFELGEMFFSEGAAVNRFSHFNVKLEIYNWNGRKS